MPPSDIGAAAAYEVWRTWRYHYGILAQPLSGDRERQREAIIALAVGEGISAYYTSMTLWTNYDPTQQQDYGSTLVAFRIRWAA